MDKPWHSKEWKEKRIDILNERNICEKCGTTEDLCLHHPKEDFRSPEEIRNAINNEAYREFKKDYSAKQQPKKPVHTGRHRHKSHNYWHQSSVQHRYEIDESNMSWEEKIPSHTQKEKDGFKAEFNLWKKKHDIKTLIENEIEKENQRYMALEGVMVLCKGCHKNIHMGRELCPICKKVYKELSARTCWYCRSDNEKKKIPLTDSQKKIY